MKVLILLLIASSMFGCAQIKPVKITAPKDGRVHAVVADIDGTLTPDVWLFLKSRPSAPAAIRKLSDKGYKILYVTSRPPILQPGLQRWLRSKGFPEGTLHAVNTSEEQLHPERFKARVLNEYKQRGWKLAYAYGDSSTDFAAYAKAGIPSDKVFALKRSGQKSCKKGQYQKCLVGWADHLQFIGDDVVSVEKAN